MGILLLLRPARGRGRECGGGAFIGGGWRGGLLVFSKKKQRELKVARIRKKSDFKLLFIHYQLKLQLCLIFKY